MIDNSKKGQKCYIYTRVSTAVQVEGYSLEAQMERLKRYADYEEMPIAGVYNDAGKSGKNIEGRAEFQQMLRDIENQKDNVRFVLVFKLSRFGRNAADVLSSLQFMQDYGVNLICVEDGIDSSKDSGKLMISVLSAVAEIERENILVQTMQGRKQKAREGKWNGGFSPYGYALENGELKIAEDEAEVIRLIFDKYVNTNSGATGVAKFLNQNKVVKKIRENGKLDKFSAGFVRGVLDNPVYAGKIAYGRRTMEKVDGKRNEYRQIKTDDYILVDGIHEAIITEEIWEMAKAKRKATGGKREKIYNIGRNHLLSGIIKCPVCGAGMVGNVNRKKRADGTLYRDYFYYACKHRKIVDGHSCTYKKQWKEEQINDAVVEIIRKLVQNEKFSAIIKSKIGSKVDTSEIDKEIEIYIQQLKQENTVKKNLEKQMDNLSFTERHYERKLADFQNRLDKVYDEIADLEDKLEDLKVRKRNIEMERISVDNIYKYLLCFDKLYDKFTDDEKKEFLSSFVEEVQLYEEQQESGQILKKIRFKFGVYYNGQDIEGIGWDKDGTVETVCLLERMGNRKPDTHVKLSLDIEELQKIKQQDNV